MQLGSFGVHGVFVGSHAIAAGFLSRRQLQRGPYVRVLHGVYADPTLPRDHLLRCRAAALLLPRGAAVGGRSAAALHGAPPPGYGDPVTVIVPPSVKWNGPRGIRVHTAGLPLGTIQRSGDDVPYTDVARTAWDVAALETTATAVGVLDALVRARTLDPDVLRRLLWSGRRRWRSRQVRRAFELVDGRSESPPESWVRVACALAGLPAPVPQFDVVEDGVWLARADLAWPEARVIVEYEGEYHFAGVQIARDDARIQRLVAAGWRVIRLAAHDLRQMDVVLQRIREALAAAPVAG